MGTDPWLSVDDRCRPMLRARRGHGRRGRPCSEPAGEVTSSTGGRGLSPVTTCLVGKPLRAVWQARILACVHSGEAMGARQLLAAKLYSRSCQRKMVPL